MEVCLGHGSISDDDEDMDGVSEIDYYSGMQDLIKQLEHNNDDDEEQGNEDLSLAILGVANKSVEHPKHARARKIRPIVECLNKLCVWHRLIGGCRLVSKCASLRQFYFLLLLLSALITQTINEPDKAIELNVKTKLQATTGAITPMLSLGKCTKDASSTASDIIDSVNFPRMSNDHCKHRHNHHHHHHRNYRRQKSEEQFKAKKNCNNNCSRASLPGYI
uniref:Uncharacterized protein n=1 Tax=Glossina austeni TaxID=7395 RepID=A0A1A9V845_GLOAU